MENAWETVRHQVAIAGHVRNAQTGRVIAGALVRITTGPVGFMDWITVRAEQYGESWDMLTERADRTRTVADGRFGFVDLPDGTYTLQASLPDAGTRYGTARMNVTVARDALGDIISPVAELAVPPTTLMGRITDQISGEPIRMAEMIVKGSGERVFSDGRGNYQLFGLEAGQHAVEVAVQGYRPATRTVTLPTPGGETTLDIALVVSGQ